MTHRREHDGGSAPMPPQRRPPAEAFGGPIMGAPRLARRNLSDQIARQIHARICQGEYQVGDRLPAIREIARSFGVGPPTVREGLKALEAHGVIEIRPGSGVYVNNGGHVLVATPRRAGGATRKLLVDLIEARSPLETHAAATAAQHATVADLKRMRELLTTAARSLRGDLLNSAGEGFHQLVALASGNSVIAQFMEALADLFRDEHRLIWAIADSRECDHQAHLRILGAIERGDGAAAAEHMRAHMDAVRAAVLQVGAADAVAV